MVESRRRWGLEPAEWEGAKESLRSLVAQAAVCRSTVTYGEAARVAFGGRFSARSGALMDLLGEVDTEEEASRGVIVASLVVRKDTGMPGDGYFAFVADELGHEVIDRAAYWREQAEAVWRAYGSAVG